MIIFLYQVGPARDGSTAPESPRNPPVQQHSAQPPIHLSFDEVSSKSVRQRVLKQIVKSKVFGKAINDGQCMTMHPMQTSCGTSCCQKAQRSRQANWRWTSPRPHCQHEPAQCSTFSTSFDRLSHDTWAVLSKDSTLTRYSRTEAPPSC